MGTADAHTLSSGHYNPAILQEQLRRPEFSLKRGVIQALVSVQAIYGHWNALVRHRATACDGRSTAPFVETVMVVQDRKCMIMIRRYDHQGISIFSSKTKSHGNGLVKVDDLIDQLLASPQAVKGPVDLPPLHHQEEARLMTI